LLLVDIAGLSGFLLLVHIAGLSGGVGTIDCFFAFAFPSAFPSLFLFSIGWEGAGCGVPQELGKG
jgi:hypothetical protein